MPRHLSAKRLRSIITGDPNPALPNREYKCRVTFTTGKKDTFMMAAYNRHEVKLILLLDQRVQTINGIKYTRLIKPKRRAA